MDRSDALRQIEALLRQHGRDDLVGELESIEAAAEVRTAQAKTIADVTRALLESEKTYRLVFSHEIDPMSLFDATTGRFVEVNDAWVELYGYSREEALTMRVTDVSAEPSATQTAIAALPRGTSTRINLRWHRSKDGTVFPVELTSGKLTLGDRPVAYAVMRDITQRADAERQLARSESRFRALIESMPDGVIVHRLGLVVYMSPSARRMLGYTLDERVGHVMAIELVHPDDRERVVARWTEMVVRGEAAPAVEERLLRKDGGSVAVEVVAHSTTFDGERAILAIARDVSARKEIEAQLVMNDRLASLGRLAASIGHELNNPLAYILNNVEMLTRQISRADLREETSFRLRQHTSLIHEGAMRMRDIVRDLRRLARGDLDASSPIEIKSVLDVCIGMAEREIVSRARLVRNLQAGEGIVVSGSEALLGQVFLNLLLNAAQSIVSGPPCENEVGIAIQGVENGHVAIEIRDTGSGILPENRDRIFEPLFTTKEGEGTGLGLSICHRIVRLAGGTLSAQPNGERGTIFRVMLPVADAKPINT